MEGKEQEFEEAMISRGGGKRLKCALPANEFSI